MLKNSNRLDNNMSNDIKRIGFDKIDPNPFRDFIRNPPTEDHLAILQKSVENTGFWNTCIVRPHPDKNNYYQLMFGHARVEAAKRAGLTSAYFAIRNADDEEAIILMTNENSTQGRDKYAAVAESVRAAMGYIMLDLLHFGTDSKFAVGDPNRDGQLLANVKTGGNVGYETVFKFFGGTLDKHNIRLAIDTMKDTGEIEEWHKTNNPNLNNKPIDPVVSYEAISHFEKPDHVRTFTKAVKEMHIPASEQPDLVKLITAKLAPPPKKFKNGREGFQSNIDSDKRFNSTNIRKVVVEIGLDRTRDDKRKEKLAQIALLTDLEKSLTEIEAGLTRTNNGYIRMKETVRVIGGILPTDITSVVSIKLKNIAEAIRKLDKLLKTKDTRKLLQIEGE